jgi:hypothetical protein
MEGREWQNPYPDWPPGEVYTVSEETQERIVKARDHFLHLLEHPRKFAEYLGIKEALDKAEDDFSVYTGSLRQLKARFSINFYAISRQMMLVLISTNCLFKTSDVY